MPLSLSRISLDASLASLSLYRFSILSPPVRPVASWSQEPSPSSADSSWGKPEGLESMGWRTGVQDLRCRAGKQAATVVRSGISAGHAGGAPLRVCCSIATRVGVPPCASGQARRVQVRFTGLWASELQQHMAVAAAELQLRVMARVAGGGRREECARLADGGCRAECERRSNAGSYSGVALDPARGSSLSLSLFTRLEPASWAGVLLGAGEARGAVRDGSTEA